MELKALMALRAARAESDGYLLLVKRRNGDWVAIRGDVSLGDLLAQAIVRPPPQGVQLPTLPAPPGEPHPENPIVVPSPPGGEIDNTLPGQPVYPGGWPVYGAEHPDAGLPIPPPGHVDNKPVYPPGHPDQGLPIPPEATQLPVWPPKYPSGQPVPKPTPPSGSTKPSSPSEPKA